MSETLYRLYGVTGAAAPLPAASTVPEGTSAVSEDGRTAVYTRGGRWWTIPPPITCEADPSTGQPDHYYYA